MEVNDIPNVRTEKTLLQDGMVVKPQNVWGSPERDFLGFLDRLDWVPLACRQHWLPPSMNSGLFFWNLVHGWGGSLTIVLRNTPRVCLCTSERKNFPDGLKRLPIFAFFSIRL